MNSFDAGRVYDVVIIGAGPAGAMAAIRAARSGASVVILERGRHPRFHIGESLQPRVTALLREMGLLERVLALPHVVKYGASFAMAQDEEPSDFWFAPGPRGEEDYTVNIERAPFDALLAQIAREEGVIVIEDCGVQSIDVLRQGRVELITDRGRVTGRGLLDASGQATVVGRHLKTRRSLPDLKRVAYYQHFEGVARRPGDIGGHAIIVMATEGWFWLIPLDAKRTSIGLVMDHQSAIDVRVEAREMLAWGIERAPFVHQLMTNATGPTTNHVCSDFSYRCEPYAGPGYFLVGDAATFVDPVFSTGVCLGMMSAVRAADVMIGSLRDPSRAASHRRAYCDYVESSSAVFFRLVRNFYEHEFREMFLHGKGPVGVQEAVLTALAGHVFPEPVFSIRWRLSLFNLLRRLHQHRQMVPFREGFSLVDGRAVSRELAQQHSRSIGCGVGV